MPVQRARLLQGDCLGVLRTLECDYVDSLVTDPPAAISIMGAKFDTFKGREDFVDWLSPRLAECLRVCKPGAVGLVWALPRTSHWTALAIEEAGWLIEDRIAHLFGSGFPKAKNRLKPACEDWWLCRKPGPLWLGVEECRVTTDENCARKPSLVRTDAPCGFGRGQTMGGRGSPAGRWPANLVLDEEAARLLDEQAGPSSITGLRSDRSRNAEVAGTAWGPRNHRSKEYPNEAGGPSRFFYCAKASKRDRGAGNKHPTVKSTTLMSWLVRLACPKDGLVLDPFAGTFSTGIACLRSNRRFVGVESDPEHFATGKARMEAARLDYLNGVA